MWLWLVKCTSKYVVTPSQSHTHTHTLTVTHTHTHTHSHTPHTHTLTDCTVTMQEPPEPMQVSLAGLYVSSCNLNYVILIVLASVVYIYGCMLCVCHAWFTARSLHSYCTLRDNLHASCHAIIWPVFWHFWSKYNVETKATHTWFMACSRHSYDACSHIWYVQYCILAQRFLFPMCVYLQLVYTECYIFYARSFEAYVSNVFVCFSTTCCNCYVVSEPTRCNSTTTWCGLW